MSTEQIIASFTMGILFGAIELIFILHLLPRGGKDIEAVSSFIKYDLKHESNCEIIEVHKDCLEVEGIQSCRSASMRMSNDLLSVKAYEFISHEETLNAYKKLIKARTMEIKEQKMEYKKLTRSFRCPKFFDTVIGYREHAMCVGDIVTRILVKDKMLLVIQGNLKASDLDNTEVIQNALGF